jgi:DNA-binding NarL/FixJ family response regulator
MTSLRLLVADDDKSIRGLVCTLLGAKDGWQVCGEATNGKEAVEKVRELNPDVIILDLSMPVMNGFEAGPKIRRIAPSTKIVFFSVHDAPLSFGQFGADAFVPKLSAEQELVPTIERVAGDVQKPASLPNRVSAPSPKLP